MAKSNEEIREPRVKRDRARRPLRYHVLHWLDALTWPASVVIRALIFAIKGIRGLFGRLTAH